MNEHAQTAKDRSADASTGSPRKRRLRAGFVDPCARKGPLTAAGKARASENGRRHGLCVPAHYDPAASAEIDAMAQEICTSARHALRSEMQAHAQDDASAELRRLAGRIAEAQIDLVRVRRARNDLIAWAFANPLYRPAKGLHAWIRLLAKAGELIVQGVALPPDLRNAIMIKPHGADKLALILCDASAELARMDRYERRALSRRKFAVREFDAACNA
jgi:hypothetical protein